MTAAALGKASRANSSVDDGPDLVAMARQAVEKTLSRHDRYRAGTRLRQLNRYLWPKERVGTCGRRRGQTVSLQRSSKGQGVSWSGIETCGSIWACPICASKVRAARGDEVRFYIEHHLDRGGYVTLVSLTTSHSWAENLVDVYDDVQRAWAKTTSGRPWTRLVEQYGILGPIVAVEVTCGCNGWHPHLHVLLFHWKPMGRAGSDMDLAGDLRDRWTYMVDKHTDRTALGRVGCDVIPISGEAGIAAYMSKVHYEMTRGDLKRGRWGSRSAWQVGMDAAETSDARDIRAWKEYVEATKGRRMLRVSKELVAWYGKPVTTDISDEDLAAVEQDGPSVLHFTGGLYDRIHASRSLLSAEVPIAFESGGLLEVLNLLRREISPNVNILANRCTDNGDQSRVDGAWASAPLIGLSLT
ncbi:MAG: hypothetical protein GY926_00580 [bacterium]|nr:hypothetical protein [bacterium]